MLRPTAVVALLLTAGGLLGACGEDTPATPSKSATTQSGAGPATVRGRTLPEGFEAISGAPLHSSGWPTRIRCLKDGSEMAFVPGGGFVSGLSDTQIDELTGIVMTIRKASGGQDYVVQLYGRIDGLDRMQSGGLLQAQDLDGIGRKTMDEQLAVLVLAAMQEQNVPIPARALEQWRKGERTFRNLLSIPGVQKMVGLTDAQVRMLTMRTKIPVGDQHVATRTRVREETFVYRAASTGAFYIDVHEVSNARYKRFIQADADHKKDHSPGIWINIIKSKSDRSGAKKVFYDLWADEGRNGDAQPVTCISPEDAEAYARWAGKALPTRLQRERAAVGEGGRLFPWGRKFAPGMASCGIGATISAAALAKKRAISDVIGTAQDASGLLKKNIQSPPPSPVGSHEADTSPYGCKDMAGNVSEYVRLAADEVADGKAHAVVGGNAWSADVVDLSPAAREPAAFDPKLIGFRTILVVDSKD